MLSSGLSANDNWPQWRGEKLDSVSGESGLPGELDKEKNLLWRTELPGPAGASPVVWGDKVFVSTIADDKLELHCISTSGKPLWKKRLDGVNRNSRDGGNSASPSPCTDGEHVWCMMGDGMLYCFTMDGNQVWKNNLQAMYGEFIIQFGMTSTPILDNGRLYLQLIHGSMRERDKTSEGWVLAFDAKSGKEIWKHRRKTDGIIENKHSYASPTIYRDADVKYLLTHGGDYVIAHSLKDGSEIWRCGGLNPKGSGYNPTLRFVSSPTTVPGMIVVPTAKNGVVKSLKPGLKGDVTNQESSQHWVMKRGTPDVATPLIHDGLVYLARENGVLVCVDAKTGELVYQERILDDRHRSTPVYADGKIYLAGRKGNIVVVKAGREMEVISKCELGEQTTASPAIADGMVFIRTFDALYAFGNK